MQSENTTDDTVNDIAEISQMSHIQLCRLWRFGRIGDSRLQGDCGELVRKRLFEEFDGITPVISKQIGFSDYQT